MKNKKTFSRLLRYTQSLLPYLAGAVVCAAVSVILSLYVPIIIGKAVDCIIGTEDVDFAGIWKYSMLLAATVVGSGVFGWILNLFTNRLTFGAVRSMRMDAFNKLNSVPISYIDSHAHGDLITRVVGDIDTVSDGLLQGFTQLFSGLVTIIGTLIFMFSVNIVIGAVVVVVTPLSLVVASVITRACHRMFSEQSRVRGKLNGVVEEMLGNQKAVKAMMYEENSFEKFDGINVELLDCGFKAQFYSALVNPCTRFVNGLVYALVGGTGALSAISGHISVGQLSCLLSYANQYTKPFNEISGVIAEFQSALASADRVFDLLDSPSETENRENTLPQVNGALDFRNVAFSYTPERELIKNLNLTVRSGQRVAIVGPTGCGKTTLINLLMRFYDVTDGIISLENTDIRTVGRDELRRNYGMVLQESWLFNGTVRENIAYGRPDASEQEIVHAAKMAYADSFIERLPQGYDTVISESGDNISSGQKQLLCIARILLLQPPMLILDEATSNIDTLTEQRIQKAFEYLMKGRTSFIVAHRLSTIRNADLILVMNNGSVIEQGNHDQLIAKNGFYTKLYNSQFEK